ncbi:hypothetical protein [Paenibacillus sp. B1-33]|uniref:hypothetical protein n=1 Tax=unclassified Paenibacillus TaxID=185978 RepID=UPI003D2CD59E
MKKFSKTLSALALGTVLMVPGSVFASTDTNETQLISEEMVRLTVTNEATNETTRSLATTSTESKEFTLKQYNDNGVTVYGFDVEDPSYRQAAMSYINKLTGDTGAVFQPVGLLPGESEYQNDTQTDGNAMSYAWKINTAGNWDNNFEGGQSSAWNGSGNASYIVLNQNISVSGIGVTVSWPPGVSGSSTSGSWQSQPIKDNVAGASFAGMKVSGTSWATSFSENGDVYVNNRVYRPVTYIKFSVF